MADITPQSSLTYESQQAGPRSRPDTPTQAISPICVARALQDHDIHIHPSPRRVVLDLPSFNQFTSHIDSQSDDDADSRTNTADTASESGHTDLESAPSIYSYRSSRDGAFMKVEAHGRMVNGQTDLYALPADEEEHARLDTQHVMLQAALGGYLYPDPKRVEAALAPTRERKRQILDVGSGAGVWTIQMAHQYPDAEVIGVDLVLPAGDRPVPDNCRFEADDVTLGMSHYHSVFDFVHCRAISHGVPDMEAFIDDIADTLRPGGVLCLVDGMMQLFREDKSLMDASESSFQKVLFHSYNALKSRGSGVDTCLLLPRMLEKTSKLKNLGYRQYFIPIGTWYDGDGTFEDRRRWHEMGELLRHDCHGFADALRPLLLSDGFKQEWVDEWIAEAHKELNEDRIRGWAVWVYFWADREDYDIAPLNPPPSPRERATTEATGENESVDELASKLSETHVDELEHGAVKDRKATGDLVELWLGNTEADEEQERAEAEERSKHESALPTVKSDSKQEEEEGPSSIFAYSV
ncbi:S-adenosyl-L-methionine-dependent methyltransferase [Calocera cornea HHB12733]|uniref:S-adenosyl-L-methionine-dependent methyltransferase n=1 Tax=Calocera cornea HHB12733 TaxID=1353952 RepID=A0A165GIX7_9BASI|nr:S-adenosyl-L-methionine-dependent methyltransferase [Calocera cornea HHB12733]